jgi:RNA polymerase sigma factor (sigma-70 family)
MSIVPVCHSSGVARFACAQTGCRECQEALLQANERLIHRVILEQAIGGIEYQDLVQEGRIAVWRSILHFDPGRGNAFSTYAWTAIYRHLWAYVEMTEQSREYVEVEEWLDTPGQAEMAWQAEQVRQALLEEVVCLPERLRQVIVLYYGLGGGWPRDLGEIGRAWGISRERVRQLRNNALVLLRLPALSQPVRFLCEQDSRAAYRQALALNRAWQRSQRRRP